MNQLLCYWLEWSHEIHSTTTHSYRASDVLQPGLRRWTSRRPAQLAEQRIQAFNHSNGEHIKTDRHETVLGNAETCRSGSED